MWDRLRPMRLYHYLASFAILVSTPSYSQTVQLPVQITVIANDAEHGLICASTFGTVRCADIFNHVTAFSMKSPGVWASLQNPPTGTGDVNHVIKDPRQIWGGNNSLIHRPLEDIGTGRDPDNGVNSISEQQPFGFCAPPCSINPFD